MQGEKSHNVYFAYILNEAGKHNADLQRLTYILDTILQ